MTRAAGWRAAAQDSYTKARHTQNSAIKFWVHSAITADTLLHTADTLLQTANTLLQTANTLLQTATNLRPTCDQLATNLQTHPRTRYEPAALLDQSSLAHRERDTQCGLSPR